MPKSLIDVAFGKRENELRAAFLAGTSAEDMVTAMNVLREEALINGDIDALRLFLGYTLGTVGRARRMMPRLELPERTTLEQCGAALDVVIDAMADGILSEDEASTYITTIEKRAAILRAQLGLAEPDDGTHRPIVIQLQNRAETDPAS